MLRVYACLSNGVDGIVAVKYGHAI
jgi:hypothetical protein